jgi:hypothetical protein
VAQVKIIFLESPFSKIATLLLVSISIAEKLVISIGFSKIYSCKLDR